MPEKHITCINNMGGTAAAAQKAEAKIANSLGWRDMGIYFYNADSDTDGELSRRLDGVISLVNNGDLVLFQYPSWNGYRFDEAFIDKLHMYKCRVILHVQDVRALLFGALKGDELRKSVEDDVRVMNKSDALILASERLKTELEKYGLRKNIPVMYQKIYDTPTDLVPAKHEPVKRMLFTGGEDISEYKGNITVYQFSAADRSNGNPSIKWMGFYDRIDLQTELGRGGFGLVWANDEDFKRYDCMNQSYKLACYLAAGIPVLVRKGAVHEEFVKRQGIGFVINSLEEAEKLIEALTDDDIRNLYERVRPIQQLICDGIYTKKMLVDAEIMMTESL